MRPMIQIVFDAGDPHALAVFWAAALRYEVEDHSEVVHYLELAGQLNEVDVLVIGKRRVFKDVAACSDPESDGPRLLFQRVPEPKTTKNRVHLDLQVGPMAAAAEVERLVALGATVAWTTTDRGPVTTTLHDPEGNELCVS